MPAQRSIVICGGAFAGLALALAFRQGLGADVPVVVADPALATRPSRDPRATAIVAACRRLFEALGVWDQVAAGAQPILDMVVTDSKLEDATRPVFLTFAGDVEPGCFSKGARILDGHQARVRQRVRGCQLHGQPRVVFLLVAPDRAHLTMGVPWNHSARSSGDRPSAAGLASGCLSER